MRSAWRAGKTQATRAVAPSSTLTLRYVTGSCGLIPSSRFAMTRERRSDSPAPTAIPITDRRHCLAHNITKHALVAGAEREAYTDLRGLTGYGVTR